MVFRTPSPSREPFSLTIDSPDSGVLSHAIRVNVGEFGSDVGERDRNVILGWSSLKQKIH